MAADNDGFVDWVGPGVQADRYYTHGFRFQGVVEWKASGAGVLSTESLPVCHEEPDERGCFLTRLILGHAIYTPGYLFDEVPASDDRPYAGWLYGDVMVGKVRADRITALGLQVGVTGPPSFASPVHRWFHRTLGKEEPRGWDHQLPFEPAFSLRFQSRQSFPLLGRVGEIFFGVAPDVTVTAGTLRSGVAAGLSLEGGWNAPSTLDWLGPGLDGPYVLVRLGAEGEFVLRDLFLDGSLWREGPSVDRSPGFGSLKGGVQVGVRRFGIEVAAVRSMPEFQNQLDSHTYGIIRLVFRH